MHPPPRLEPIVSGTALVCVCCRQESKLEYDTAGLAGNSESTNQAVLDRLTRELASLAMSGNSSLRLLMEARMRILNRVKSCFEMNAHVLKTEQSATSNSVAVQVWMFPGMNRDGWA